MSDAGAASLEACPPSPHLGFIINAGEPQRTRMRSLLTLSLSAWLLLALNPALADGLRLMTWNIEGGEQPPRVIAERVEAALAETGPVEVLVLQEVIDEAQVEAAAEAGGFAHWAISDFSPPVGSPAPGTSRSRSRS